MGAMDIYAVKPCFFCEASGLNVGFDQALDLFPGQGMGRLCPWIERQPGRCHGLKAGHFGIGPSSCMVDLDKYLRVIIQPMNGLG
jgi:hypothetical protein